METEGVVDEEVLYAVSALVEKIKSLPEEYMQEGIAAFFVYEIVVKAFPTKTRSVGVLETAKQLVWNEGELR